MECRRAGTARVACTGSLDVLYGSLCIWFQTLYGFPLPSCSNSCLCISVTPPVDLVAMAVREARSTRNRKSLKEPDIECVLRGGVACSEGYPAWIDVQSTLFIRRDDGWDSDKEEEDDDEDVQPADVATDRKRKVGRCCGRCCCCCGAAFLCISVHGSVVVNALHWTELLRQFHKFKRRRPPRSKRRMQLAQLLLKSGPESHQRISMTCSCLVRLVAFGEVAPCNLLHNGTACAQQCSGLISTACNDPWRFRIV